MFTAEEINNLIDCVTAWENEPAHLKTAGLMLGVMLSRSKEEAEKVAHKAENDTGDTKIRKEQAVLLKAKLIKMRDELAVQEIVETT